jgi:hypothetical protein
MIENPTEGCLRLLPEVREVNARAMGTLPGPVRSGDWHGTVADVAVSALDGRATLSPMPRLMLGSICGLVYGALSAASMLPMQFPDKRAALLGAFINRFSIGFVIGALALPWPGWASGLLIGVLLSLADAIITKAYAPIVVLGAIGGTLIGWIVQRFGR